MSDNIIWRTIGGKDKFCSFKLASKTITLCKNPNSVTNICEQESCPLANSKYATVREKNDKLYLYIKEPERLRTPKLTYEIIELSNDYQQAILEIDKHLEFFSELLKHKCKQRLTKLYQYLERKKEPKVQYSVLKKKFERKEKINAEKLKKKMNIMKEVEEEIMERMMQGMYGEEIKDVMKARKEKNSEKILENKKEKKNEKIKYVAFFEESAETNDFGKKGTRNLEW